MTPYNALAWCCTFENYSDGVSLYDAMSAIFTCLFTFAYCHSCSLCAKKVKGFPYSLPSVGLGADPSVQAVIPQVT